MLFVDGKTVSEHDVVVRLLRAVSGDEGCALKMLMNAKAFRGHSEQQLLRLISGAKTCRCHR
jgi:hypothetical protein